MSLTYGRTPDRDTFWEDLAEAQKQRERRGRYKDAALICGIICLYLLMLFFFPDIH